MLASSANFVRGGDGGMTLLEVIALLSLIISVAAFAYNVGRHTGGKK
jgi:type II secretory pathway pseudopilin PulG